MLILLLKHSHRIEWYDYQNLDKYLLMLKSLINLLMKEKLMSCLMLVYCLALMKLIMKNFNH